MNQLLGESWEEWEIPRDADEGWSDEAKSVHARWWERRIIRQEKIDASIAANAEYEYLYDKPYEDRNKVRVAGPFTVESISPHRVLGVDEHGEMILEKPDGYGSGYDFAQVMLDNLKTSGVQQAHREDRIEFSSITLWPGRLVCAEGRYVEGDEEDGVERRAAIFVGPEFGTVSRPDLVEAAREAADGGFDVLIACAFNYEAHTTEFESLGRVPVLKARMNADLHMADELKNTGSGNLFVIFGEPDIDILDAGDDQVQVRVNGVDVFHPNTGEVRSDGPDASPAGSSTPTTTRRRSSSDTPTSWEPATRTSRSRPRSRPRSTPTPGRRSRAIRRARSTSPSRAGSPSRSSTTSATRC